MNLEQVGEVMSREQVFAIDVGAEVDRYFDASSVQANEAPRIVLLMGGVAVGKTTMRRKTYGTGYVLVDAADIFINLSRGDYLPFPEAFEEPMGLIGALIAARAIKEGRHIVTELIGADFEPTKALIESMKGIGYKVDIVAIECELEESIRRSENRGDDNISAYYAEKFQRKWLLEAAAKSLGN